MATKTPNVVAADWAQRLGASTTKIKTGVMAVTTAPGTLAARQKDLWATQVAASKTKWAARTAAVSLQTWQQDMVTKGLSRVGPGAQAAEPKMAAFMSQLLPFITRLKTSLPPRGNVTQNINRMTAFVRGMTQFSSQRTGA